MGIAEVTLATSGTVDRDDKCPKCGAGMYYRVNDAGLPKSKLCGNLLGCEAALVEVSLAD